MAQNERFSISFPKNGDVLNRHDGTETEDGLEISVRGEAAETSRVSVNGVETRRDGTAFFCDVLLTEREGSITIQADDTKTVLEVLWDKGSRKRFRFSTDDNIEFFKDLASDPKAYPSLFDHPYLGFWRDMHTTYGTKIHINIYYQTEGFNLTQMPDKWKSEWRENASWMHLSFHALQDKPDRPYHDATYEQIARDYELVLDEIERFAGLEVVSDTTTLHWADCPTKSLAALQDRGINRVIGLFWSRNGECTTGYQLPLEVTEHCDSRGAWRDPESGLFFVRCTAVVNSLSVGEVAAFLDERTSTPQTAEMVELLIHEQYFRKELHYYQPDVEEKVRRALNWVTSKGYEPVFWSDGFLGTT